MTSKSTRESIQPMTKDDFEFTMNATTAAILGEQPEPEPDPKTKKLAFDALDEAYSLGVDQTKAAIIAVLDTSVAMLTEMKAGPMMAQFQGEIRTTIGALKSIATMVQDKDFVARKLSSYERLTTIEGEKHDD